jgi:hypothetical protein
MSMPLNYRAERAHLVASQMFQTACEAMQASFPTASPSVIAGATAVRLLSQHSLATVSRGFRTIQGGKR